jgi:pyochelin synthetase
VDIWEDVLSTKPIGLHEDFFELGGQSFAALRVSVQIAQRLGRRVPLGVLLEHRTVARLAKWLEAPETAWSPLVRLRETAEGSAWFFVHPAGGNVLCYRALAELLDSPSYGFQAPGLTTGAKPLDRVEDLAAEYVRALLDVQPRGPYRLGGWSSGAVMAFEMAHQLERRGESVDRLVVIDAPAPAAPRAIEDAELLLWFLEDLNIGFDPARVDADAVRDLGAAPEAERLPRALELARQQTAGATGLEAASLSTALAMFRDIVRACHCYHAPRVIADMTVVRASHGEISEFSDHPAAAPDWGWSRLTSGTVDSLSLPGTHHTLLTSDHIAAVADAIQGRQGPAKPKPDHQHSTR